MRGEGEVKERAASSSSVSVLTYLQVTSKALRDHMDSYFLAETVPPPAPHPPPPAPRPPPAGSRGGGGERSGATAGRRACPSATRGGGGGATGHASSKAKRLRAAGG